MTSRTDQAGPATLSLTAGLSRQLGQQQLVERTGTTTLPLAGAAGLATGVSLVPVQQAGQQQTLQRVRQ